MMAQIRMGHVAYKGGAPGIVDLVGGQVALMAHQQPVATAAACARRAACARWGVTSAARNHTLPDVGDGGRERPHGL